MAYGCGLIVCVQLSSWNLFNFRKSGVSVRGAALVRCKVNRLQQSNLVSPTVAVAKENVGLLNLSD